MPRNTVWCAFLIVALLLLSGGCVADRRVDTVTVSNQLNHLLELHTYEHMYRDVVYFGEERSFLFIKTVDRAVLFAVDIRVRAGLDLSAGVELTLDRTNPDRIYVRLPAARVLSVDADERSIHEYFVREQGGSIGLMELTQQLDDVKARTATDAVERGILDHADANARVIVQTFLRLAGFQDVVFSSPDPGDAEFRG